MSLGNSALASSKPGGERLRRNEITPARRAVSLADQYTQCMQAELLRILCACRV